MYFGYLLYVFGETDSMFVITKYKLSRETINALFYYFVSCQKFKK